MFGLYELVYLMVMAHYYLQVLKCQELINVTSTFRIVNYLYRAKKHLNKKIILFLNKAWTINFKLES